MVSARGTNFANCGQGIPCRTIGFVMTHRAASNDIIRIEGKKHDKPYIISRSFNMLRNITLLGIHGQPIIKVQDSLRVTHLFQVKELSMPQVITLRIENLIFRGIGIAQIINVNSKSNISFSDCHFKNIYTSGDIIRIKTRSSGVHNGLVHFCGCSFVNNIALESSGAIFIDHVQSMFHKCYFKDNLSTCKGLIVLTGGISIIKHSYFEKNTLVGKNIAYTTSIITANSTIQILNSTFKRNKVPRAGGAISVFGKRLVIRSSLFQYNTARFGGAIFAFITSTVEISSCSFIGNEAKVGGAILTNGKLLVIKSSLFKSNKASDKYDTTSGGAISSYPNSVVHILNCSFEGNDAAFGGSIHTTGGKLTITSSLFEHNTAGSAGFAGEGGAVLSDSIVDIMNCSFKRNQAVFIRGAISYNTKNIVIRSSVFEHNVALHHHAVKSVGGAVAVVNASIVQILNCSFKKNQAMHWGGAIVTMGRIIIRIINCSIKRNKAYAGGAAFIVGMVMVIKSSLFEYNTASEGSGGALFIQYNDQSSFKNSLEDDRTVTGSSDTLSIFSCSFRANFAKREGGAIKLNGVHFSIKASSFNNNSVGENGGAIFIFSSYTRDSISNCSFTSNKAIVNGGAVSYIGRGIYIKTSIFHNNTAIGIIGEGGALYLDSISYSFLQKVYIFHCVFDANKASFRGGAIMTANNNLWIVSSSFRSMLFYPQSKAYFGGELLYSKSQVVLELVSFLDADNFNLQNSLILHQSTITKKTGNLIEWNHLTIYFKTEVHIKCLTGKNVAASNNTSQYKNIFPFISVSCSFCSHNFYSLYMSHIDFFSQNHSMKRTNVECYRCPLGGVCERGKIRAADNFWGFIVGKEVRFVSCPFGYCCFNKECVNHFSCHAGRTGILCGQCKKDLTENLVTADCLQTENCRHPWYMLVVAIIGIVYVSVLMYTNEITKTLKVMLVPKFMSTYLKYCTETPIKIPEICKYMLHYIRIRFVNGFNGGCEIQYLTDDVYVQDTGNEEESEQIQGWVELVNDEEMQSVVSIGKVDSEDNVFPGLLRIVLFFYQTNVLFKIYTGSKSHGLVQMFQETMSALFNLRTDGAFAQNLSWCPIDNLQPVSKVLLKSFFILYLFFLTFLVFLLCKAGRLLKIISTKLNNARLLCCIL